MKDLNITFGQLEDALKHLYGEKAGLDIVEPIILIPNTGRVEDVRSFDNNLALILYKNKPSYCPMDDNIDLVKKAKKSGNIVVPIPADKAPSLSADNTQRNYGRVCAKYPDCLFIIPQIEISSVLDATISTKTLIKNKAKDVVAYISKSMKNSQGSVGKNDTSEQE